jgi:hypothetical protein
MLASIIRVTPLSLLLLQIIAKKQTVEKDTYKPMNGGWVMMGLFQDSRVFAGGWGEGN